MNSRTVLLGKTHADILFGVEAILNAGASRKGIKDVDYRGIFYAYMIQTGIEKVEMLDTHVGYSNSEFIKRRTVSIPEDTWRSTYRKLRDAFTQPVENSHNYPPDQLLRFLTDLMLAIERKSNLVMTGIGMPDISELERTLPLELFIPLKIFFGTIESESANLPLPQDFISIDNFNRLQDIILSDLFNHYSSTHEAFEDGRVLKLNAIKSVEKAGYLLLERNQKYLKAQQLAVSLIPITSKIIDAVFGKFPGILADFFVQQLSEWLKDNRRIVIYRLDPLVDLMFKNWDMVFDIVHPRDE
jgi:hypothetical protein